MSINKIIIRVEDTPTHRLLPPPASISSLLVSAFLSFQSMSSSSSAAATGVFVRRPTKDPPIDMHCLCSFCLLSLWSLCGHPLLFIPERQKKEVGIVHYPLSGFDSRSRNWSSGLKLIFLLRSSSSSIVYMDPRPTITIYGLYPIFRGYSFDFITPPVLSILRN